MSTRNYYIAPQDGWVEIASEPRFLRVSCFPAKYSFYLIGQDLAPTNSDLGDLIQHQPYWSNIASDDTYWVRVANPAPDSGYNGKLRIDVLMGDITGHALLMESGGYLLLEDGSKILLE